MFPLPFSPRGGFAMDRYIDDLKHGDILKDIATGEFVLLTNGTCSLPHDSTEAYRAGHSDGCRYLPFEGLVFTGTADDLTTWGMQTITKRKLAKADDADAAKVKAFYHQRIEEMSKKPRRKRAG